MLAQNVISSEGHEQFAISVSHLSNIRSALRHQLPEEVVLTPPPPISPCQIVKTVMKLKTTGIVRSELRAVELLGVLEKPDR